MFLLVGFVVSWTPYAIACLYVAFFNTTLPPLVATIPAFFAKASLLWPSLLNILTNNDIKTRLPFKNIRQVFPFTLSKPVYIFIFLVLHSISIFQFKTLLLKDLQEIINKFYKFH